jgi:transmembrane protein TMEM260 (protein O-mannosyltransferase)
MMKYFRIIPGVIFLIAFVTFLLTLTPTVDFIDSGELAAVCSTLGIAHPTGYPLFTLIGHLFSRIPVAETVIGRLNVMSALFAALGAGLFTVLVKQILGIMAAVGSEKRGKKRRDRRPESGRDKNGREFLLSEKLQWMAAAAAGLLLCWTAIFWEAGSTLEVYSLHALFTVLLLSLAVRYASEKEPKRELRLGLIFFFVLGLSLANHLTTGLLFPAFLLLFLVKYISQRTSFSRIVLVMLPALIGIAFYLYLPIRAAGRPLIMWGEPTTLASIWDNLTVADFSSRLFSHQSEGETLLDFFLRFPGRVGYLPVPLVIWGIALLYRKSKSYFFFILAAFIPAILYAATYNVGDNIFYFNPAYISLLIFGGVGVYGLFQYIWRRIHLLWPALLLIVVIPLPELILNYPRVDKKNNYFVEDYIHNIFSPIEPNAILFALDCQIIIHPLYYYQTVERFREDVLVLPNHGLQKGWFANRLHDHYPEIYRRSAREIEDYRAYLNRGASADPRVLDKKYYTMLFSIISHNPDRPIYITSEFNPVQNPYFHPGYYRIPEGLCWRLYREGQLPAEFPYREFSYRELTYPHKDADAVRHAYMYMLNERGKYEASRGNYETALRWIDQALRVYPEEELLSGHSNGTWVVPNRFREIQKIREKVARSGKK